LKNSKMGVRPSMTVDQSAKAIFDLDKARHQTKTVKHANLLDQQRTKPKEIYETQLYDTIVDNAVHRLCSQYSSSGDYVYRRINEDTFLVLRNGYQQYSNDHNKKEEFKKYMIPKFARVRVVKIVKFNDIHYLVCSCGYFDRFGLGCRHVYKIRDLPPKQEDASVRYRIDYLRYFNKPGFEELTTCFDACLKKEPPGIPLCRPCTFVAVGVGDAPDDLLKGSQATMQGDPKIRPGTHWHVADKESVSPDQDAVSTKKKQQFGDVQPLLEEAVGLSQYALENEGETKIGNGSQFAEQGESEDECMPACNADETEIGNGYTQDCIATIDIKEPTSQKLEEFRQSTTRGGGPYSNTMPLFQQMTNCAETNPRLYSIFMQGLSATYSLMQDEAQCGTGNGTAGNIISHPNVDHKRKCTRKKQATSPKKRQRR
jgi:hypothetical protein